MHAALALEKDEMRAVFDPSRLGSRPTSAQREIFDDMGRVQFRYIVAGNQCLTKGTLVATPTGPVAIELIKPGDTVYDEHGKPINVLKTFQNGVKSVADLTLRGMIWASCTEEHVFQVNDCRNIVRERKAGELGRDDKIRRVTVQAPLGNVRVPDAYALGALLGDGCSKQRGPRLQLSSGIRDVPEKVAGILGNTAVRLHEKNYNWSVGAHAPAYYDEWCKGRYAHEKVVNLDVVKTWDRQSLLEFVAGVVDTDGSIHPSSDHISLSVGMQAKSVIDAIEYAFLALWQIPLSRRLDEREKYKNGPIHVVYTRNAVFIRQVLRELDPHLVSPQKRWRPEYETLGGRRTRTDSLGLKYGANVREEETFDIHVDSPTNLYLLANGLVTHNSGKSAIPAREIGWLLNGDHPTWTRPPEWPLGPLKIIVAGQDRKMMELELWENKISRFLDKSEWRESRQGGSLQFVEHKTEGHLIIFISHADSSERNIKHMQGYVAHYVWLDEMPMSVRVLEELQRRVDANRGYFIATFTPKFRNIAIKKMVDAVKEPLAKRYRLSKLDNPLYADRRQEEIDKLAGLSESLRNSILYGDWLPIEGGVYEFTPDLHGGRPEHYSPTWRHVLVVDPATESKLGLLLVAEDPVPRDAALRPLPPEADISKARREWWIVRAEYVEGIYVPTKIIEEVERRVAGVNIVERRSDDAATWYIRQAAEMPGGVSYDYKGIGRKNVEGRKDDLIKKFQEMLGCGLRIFDESCLPLVDEMQTCERNPETGTIKSKSRFHLIDCAHYFVDRVPEPDHQYVYATHHDRIWMAHLERERRESAMKKRYTRGGRTQHYIPPTRPAMEAPIPPMPRPRTMRRGGRKTYRLS